MMSLCKNQNSVNREPLRIVSERHLHLILDLNSMSLFRTFLSPLIARQNPHQTLSTLSTRTMSAVVREQATASFKMVRFSVLLRLLRLTFLRFRMLT